MLWTVVDRVAKELGLSKEGEKVLPVVVVDVDKSATSQEFQRIYNTLKSLCCDEKKAYGIICLSNAASIGSMSQTRIRHIWKLDFTSAEAKRYLESQSKLLKDDSVIEEIGISEAIDSDKKEIGISDSEVIDSDKKQIYISQVINRVIEEIGTRPSDLAEFIWVAGEVGLVTALEGMVQNKRLDADGIFAEAVGGKHGGFVKEVISALLKSDRAVMFKNVKGTPKDYAKILQGLVICDKQRGQYCFYSPVVREISLETFPEA